MRVREEVGIGRLEDLGLKLGLFGWVVLSRFFERGRMKIWVYMVFL